jgi:competence protein ComEA
MSPCRPSAAALLAAAVSLAVAAGPAVEINRADRAELEAVKGIGPALADSILEARAKAPFENWAALLARVKGLGSASAARLSAAGVTVNGAAFEPTPAAGTGQGRPPP